MASDRGRSNVHKPYFRGFLSFGRGAHGSTVIPGKTRNAFIMLPNYAVTQGIDLYHAGLYKMRPLAFGCGKRSGKTVVLYRGETVLGRDSKKTL